MVHVFIACRLGNIADFILTRFKQVARILYAEVGYIGFWRHIAGGGKNFFKIGVAYAAHCGEPFDFKILGKMLGYVVHAGLNFFQLSARHICRFLIQQTENFIKITGGGIEVAAFLLPPCGFRTLEQNGHSFIILTFDREGVTLNRNICIKKYIYTTSRFNSFYLVFNLLPALWEKTNPPFFVCEFMSVK